MGLDDSALMEPIQVYGKTVEFMRELEAVRGHESAFRKRASDTGACLDEIRKILEQPTPDLSRLKFVLEDLTTQAWLTSIAAQRIVQPSTKAGRVAGGLLEGLGLPDEGDKLFADMVRGWWANDSVKVGATDG